METDHGLQIASPQEKITSFQETQFEDFGDCNRRGRPPHMNLQKILEILQRDDRVHEIADTEVIRMPKEYRMPRSTFHSPKEKEDGWTNCLLT